VEDLHVECRAFKTQNWIL